MSIPVLIIGKSGTGKSRSIKNLDPKSTAIINVAGKPLPFRGWQSMYPTKKKGGNIFQPKEKRVIKGTGEDGIVNAMNVISQTRPDVTDIVIDDFQYVAGAEFMERATEKGYEKFNELAKHSWDILWGSRFLRNDIIVYILTHSETTELGETKERSFGKLLSEKLCVSGMFTICLETVIDDGYHFKTQNTGNSITKSPEGMFDSLLIDNDLNLVSKSIREYMFDPQPLEDHTETTNKKEEKEI